MKQAAFFLACASLAVSGCGYQIGPASLYAHRSVHLNVADNQTERRTHEFDLTQSVARQLQANGVRVNELDATARVALTITSISEPPLVEGKLDVVTVGSLSITVELTIVDLATGQTSSFRHSEAASFAGSRGETRDTARAVVFDRLSRWVVSNLEVAW